MQYCQNKQGIINEEYYEKWYFANAIIHYLNGNYSVESAVDGQVKERQHVISDVQRISNFFGDEILHEIEQHKQHRAAIKLRKLDFPECPMYSWINPKYKEKIAAPEIELVNAASKFFQCKGDSKIVKEKYPDEASRIIWLCHQKKLKHLLNSTIYEKLVRCREMDDLYNSVDTRGVHSKIWEFVNECLRQENVKEVLSNLNIPREVLFRILQDPYLKVIKLSDNKKMLLQHLKEELERLEQIEQKVCISLIMGKRPSEISEETAYSIKSILNYIKNLKDVNPGAYKLINSVIVKNKLMNQTSKKKVQKIPR